MSTSASPRHNHLKQKTPVGKVPVGRKTAQQGGEDELRGEDDRDRTVSGKTLRIHHRCEYRTSGQARDARCQRRTPRAIGGGEGEPGAGRRRGGLEEFVEKAFEAGIACVLGRGRAAAESRRASRRGGAASPVADAVDRAQPGEASDAARSSEPGDSGNVAATCDKERTGGRREQRPEQGRNRIVLCPLVQIDER